MTVYNAFVFFNELDLLELRLETLDPVIDYFVLCEFKVTHSGVEKPLYFWENRDRYAKFNHKILHCVIDDTPDTYDELLSMKPKNPMHGIVLDHCQKADWFGRQTPMSFVRDAYQKESMIMGLQEAELDDIVVIGDLDEIARPKSVKGVLDNFDKDNIYLLENGSYHFYLNLEKTNELWLGANILTVGKLLENPISRLKLYKTGDRIVDAGWHFSYMGGEQAIIKKIEAYGHQEFNTPQFKNQVKYILDNCIRLGVDIIGRPSTWAVRNINDGTFPQYLVDNQDKFERYILKK